MIRLLLPACLFLLGQLSGCTSILAGSMGIQYTVMHAARGPEYMMRDLGGNRYLLAQWEQQLHSNRERNVRYYDRNTGVLTRLPEEVTVSRAGWVGNIVGTVRYDSDTPLQVVFFGTRQALRDDYCHHDRDKSADDESGQSQCAKLDLVLSLDGGRSFAWRRIRIPSAMTASSREFEFAVVRNGMLYLGMYLDKLYIPNVCCRSASGDLQLKNGKVYARRFDSQTDEDYHFLGVVAVPLPANDGQPLPAAQIPQLSGTMLLGRPLLDFDLGQPMKRLNRQPPPAPELTTIGGYDRASWKAYVESLRADFPDWAAHQNLDAMPRRTQYMTSREIDALRAKATVPVPDPVEWVRLDREYLR